MQVGFILRKIPQLNVNADQIIAFKLVKEKSNPKFEIHEKNILLDSLHPNFQKLNDNDRSS